MKWKRPLRVLWALAVVLVAVASLVSPEKLPLGPQALRLGDKALHFGAYALLAMLPAAHETALVVAVVQPALIGLGAGLECAQQLTRDRTFEWADMAANSGGVAAGCLAGLALRRLLR